MRAFRSSQRPPKTFANVPFLPAPSEKICERSVPPNALEKHLRAFRSSQRPPKTNCGRSVPPNALRSNLRAFRSSQRPPITFASVPFLPAPSEKICERSVPPNALRNKLRAFRSSHRPPKNASVPSSASEQVIGHHIYLITLARFESTESIWGGMRGSAESLSITKHN
jgi:hypothetical protein